MIRFYLDIASEAQRVTNRVKGRVIKDFEPKKAIDEFNEMIQKRPTVIVENLKPIEKVVRAIPEWSDSGEPILVQIEEFVKTLIGPTGKPLRAGSKNLYKSNIKTIMNRLKRLTLIFC